MMHLRLLSVYFKPCEVFVGFKVETKGHPTIQNRKKPWQDVFSPPSRDQ